jgi:hypothetical protein
MGYPIPSEDESDGANTDAAVSAWHGADHHESPVYRGHPQPRRALHRAALRAVFRREPRGVATPVCTHPRPLATLRHREVPGRRVQAVLRPEPRAALGRCEPVPSFAVHLRLVRSPVYPWIFGSGCRRGWARRCWSGCARGRGGLRLPSVRTGLLRYASPRCPPGCR